MVFSVVLNGFPGRLLCFLKFLKVDKCINFPEVCFHKSWFELQGNVAVGNALGIPLEFEKGVGPIGQVKVTWILQAIDGLGVKFERLFVGPVGECSVACFFQCLWIGFAGFLSHLV